MLLLLLSLLPLVVVPLMVLPPLLPPGSSSTPEMGPLSLAFGPVNGGWSAVAKAAGSTSKLSVALVFLVWVAGRGALAPATSPVEV